MAPKDPHQEPAGPAGTREAARRARIDIRCGAYQDHTGNLAPGMVQGNVVILPADWADDFLRYCQLNPKPCPLLAVSNPGDPRLPAMGEDIDIRTDVPRYRVFRDGEAVDEVTDIQKLWTDDFVAFVLGCSFSFEEALLQAGLSVRNIEAGTVVPMFTTSIQTAPAGRFRGPMVVSMRPFTPVGAIRAIQITSRFPNVHGAPVHFGDPAAIGIADVNQPEYGGEPVEFRPDEVPVFWGCGVTPQAAVENACPPICITHKPGHMLITDRLNAEMAVL